MTDKEDGGMRSRRLRRAEYPALLLFPARPCEDAAMLAGQGVLRGCMQPCLVRPSFPHPDQCRKTDGNLWR